MTTREYTAWRMAQIGVWIIGTAIFFLLIFRPTVGLHLLWNGLIPVAPALFVFAPGVWRNICPLGSTSLVSRHLDLKPRRVMSLRMQGFFAFSGVFLLLVIVPMRHVVLNTNGPAIAALLGSTALLAIVSCRIFEWKSAWCSGLCPVHPVEKLYGLRPGISPKNAHCHSCHRCVQICPESTPGMNPLVGSGTRLHRWAGTIMVGGFVGFVWGWFQVPDYANAEGWQHLGQAYGWSVGAMAITLAVYLMLRRLLAPKYHTVLIRIFAASAVACYYWYRLPALVGYGPFPGDGAILDLTETLPQWVPLASQALTTTLFAWWFVCRKGVRRSWSRRPPFVVLPDGTRSLTVLHRSHG